MNITISNHDKIQKGTQLYLSDWPKNQSYIKNDIEKVPSWIRKGTQLLKKIIVPNS